MPSQCLQLWQKDSPNARLNLAGCKYAECLLWCLQQTSIPMCMNRVQHSSSVCEWKTLSCHDCTSRLNKLILRSERMKITLLQYITAAAYQELFNLCFYRQDDCQSSINEKLRFGWTWFWSLLYFRPGFTCLCRIWGSVPGYQTLSPLNRIYYFFH